MALSESERAALALVFEEVQRVRFRGIAKDAYTAAGVNPATWDRVLSGESVKPHTMVKIVSNLWPESQGDISRIPTVSPDSDDSYVAAPGDRVEGEVSNAEIMEAIRQMQRDIEELKRDRS